MKKLTPFLLLTAFMLCIHSSCYKEDEADFDSNAIAFGDEIAGDYSPEPDPVSGEEYADFVENPFISVSDQPLSTFSIDADGAAYANIRRMLNDGYLPPAGAVRVEEMINYFQYDYPDRSSGHPLSVNTEVGACPWNTEHKLIQIGVKGQEISYEELPAFNLVFLIDVSGSMGSKDKLPLLRDGFDLLLDQMRDQDRIAIVTYAGSDRVALESTSGKDKSKIRKALKNLESGGSTAGEAGILRAYQIAQENFVEGGNNRIIIATDGDFNVGISNREELVDLIEAKREEANIFLTVLGFGTGNYREATLEQMANKGNGTFEYIDNIDQAEKVFVNEFGKLYTVAKDVKIQIEFNPAVVKSYRLIGYENRVLATEDFEDDTKDAGELGVGQNVTALYEVVLSERTSLARTVPLQVDFRYKLPNSSSSNLIELEAVDDNLSWEETSENYRFIAAVAAFGMLIRDSQYAGTATYDDVLKWVDGARNYDLYGYKKEFKDLVSEAKKLDQ